MAELGYVDPNPDGLDMVNNEDLSIFVELVTTKKQRAEINVDNEAKTYKLQKGGEKVPIRLLGGTDIDGDGENELTTHYTEVNTNFNESTPNLETLGITSIDIDFNSAYTPMIKIKFVDVRGQLFEMGNTSPYNVFFNLPYPMFKLTVKGYYGKAVTYCLHLIKFTGKLNDKTGNFEIQCEFIGYTYAFLSDMLMGLMRGTIGTSIGRRIVEKTKSKNQDFLPFDELNQKIRSINDNVNKLKQDDNELAKIALGESVLESIKKLKDTVTDFSKNVVKNKKDLIYSKGNITFIIKPTKDKKVDTLENRKNRFNKRVKELINDINESTNNSRYRINPDLFSLDKKTYADDIRKIDFEKEDLWGDGLNGYLVKDSKYESKPLIVSDIITQNVGIEGEGEFSNEEYYYGFKRIVNNISNNKVDEETKMVVIDLRRAISEINDISRLLKNDLEDGRKIVSKSLVGNINQTLNFKPTMKNMVYILTEHVHVLMKSLKLVGKEVMDDQENGVRGKHLSEVVVNRNSDVSNTTETECSDGNITDSDDSDINDILPFPDYKETNDDGVFEDKWIGDVAPEIPEVRFIEELLEALLEARKEDDKTLDYLDEPEDIWYPINPFDTNLIDGNNNPWGLFEDVDDPNDVIGHMLMRMSIYLGYSNGRLSDEEVKTMAKLEARNCINNITNEDIRDYIVHYGDGVSSKEAFYNTIINDIRYEGHNYNLYTTDKIKQLKESIGEGSDIWENNSKFLNNNFWFRNIGRLFIDATGTVSGDPFQSNQPKTEEISNKDEYIYISETGRDYEDFYGPIYNSSEPDNINKQYTKWFLTLRNSNFNTNFYKGNNLVSKDGSITDDDRIKLRNSGNIFFSSTIGSIDNRLYSKEDDGSTTIKFISTNKYYNKKGQLPPTPPEVFKGINNINVFNLNSIKDIESDVDLEIKNDSGNSIGRYIGGFSGQYAFREITKIILDDDVEGIDEVGSWVRFYANTKDKPFFTGKRELAGTKKGEEYSRFDIIKDEETGKIKKNEACNTIRGQHSIFSNKNERLSKKYGKTIDVLLNYHQFDDKDMSIPFLGFECYSPKSKQDKWFYLNLDKYKDIEKLSAQYNIFGSDLYLNQDIEGKAYLFLHSIPWNGLVTLTDKGSKNLATKPFATVDDYSLFGNKRNYSGSFRNEIRGVGMSPRGSGLFTHHIQHFFKHSSGFIEAPYLWICFVGAILWRYRHDDGDPIKWEKDGYSLIPLQRRSGSSDKPSKNMYILPNIKDNEGMGFFVESDDELKKTSPMIQTSGHLYKLYDNPMPGELGVGDKPYVYIEKIITHMPENMGQKFIDEFIEFSNGGAFDSIRTEYDIFKKDNGEDATDKERVLAWLDWNHEMENDPNGWIGFNNQGEYSGHKHLNPNIYKNYIIASRDDKYATYFGEWSEPLNGDNNIAYKLFENLRKSNKSEDEKYSEALEIAKNYTNGSPFNFFLEMRSGVDTAQNKLFSELRKTKIIMSSTHRIWESMSSENMKKKYGYIAGPTTKKFSWEEKHTELYIKTFFNEYKEIIDEVSEENDSEEDRLKKRLFNSVENSDIKLQLYKTIKSIYDKWIPGSNCELELCGDGTSSGDSDECTQLIDTFTFVDRAYNNIGDDFIINPIDMVRGMLDDYNISMYDYLARMLTSNNFNFIPLPTFINFNSRSEVEDVFKPNPFNEMESSGGPTFVCIYLGEGSKNLNLGEHTQYPDDGFNLNNPECLPSDFKSGPKLEEGVNKKDIITNQKTSKKDADPDFSEDNTEEETPIVEGDNNDGIEYNIIPAFRVAYGHQNQNFFKNFKLDQSEFTETEESLKIIDELSKNNNSGIGQNMFNIYRTRAYSATIDMLGNAQIQPFMYFQLDNVPMFTGAYNIIRVKHTIKPNHMSTQFKGVRVRKTKTPLIKDTIVMMNMVGSTTDVDFEETTLDGLNTMQIDTNTFNSNVDGKPGWSGCINYPVKLNGVGIKVQSEEKVKNGTIVNYAVREVGELFERIAGEWYDKRKLSNKSHTIYYNDFSKMGGGNLPSHSSHKEGLSVDFRPPTNNTKIEVTEVGEDNYDKEGAIELIELALEISLKDNNWTNLPPIKEIYLNDDDVINYFKNEYKNRDKFTSGGVVKYWKGHYDHIHFEFNRPDSIINSESDGYIVCNDSEDDNMFPNNINNNKGELEQLTNNESNPSKDMVEGSLGKIKT